MFKINLRHVDVIREDDSYRRFEKAGRPKTLSGRAFYLILYLLPGIFAYVCINVEPVYKTLLQVLQIPGNYFQYGILIFITYVWHMILPFVILRWADGLSFKECLAYLSIDKFDLKGGTYFQFFFLVVFTLLTIPYMIYIQRPLYVWLKSIPVLAIPEYSIFRSAEALYGFPPAMIFFLLVGNFVGEELYFRGYLQKKTSFLGKYNVFINGALFSIYHLFQIPQTWPLIIPSMAFPLIMSWRRNLWTVIIFHFLVNLVWAPAIGWILMHFPN